MLYVLIGILVSAVIWLWNRQRRTVKGIAELATAVAHRKPYLHDSDRLTRPLRSWKSLIDNINDLICEASQLGRQQAGQLDQLETTLGNLHEAVFVVDAENLILLANRAFRQMFMPEGEVIGRRMEAVLGNPEFLRFAESVRRGDAPAQTEIEFTRRDQLIWVQATGAEVTPSDGDDQRWTLFVLHDITNLRRLELIRKEFVANVSHELKTPLSIIRGYAETLVDEHNSMPAADRDRFLRTVYRHSVRLAAIVEDLLTISRLESESRRMEFEAHELGSFLQDLGSEYSQRVEASGHRLIIVPPEREIVARFDALRLVRVFENLIDNAQKYCPAGSTILISTRVAGRELVVSVADDGPGIPREDLPRIFERFYRVEKGRGRESGGTGLGLSIVKHIVQTHGGRTWVESEPGHGARFMFTLPIPEGEESESDPNAVAEASSRSSSSA